MLSRGEVKTEDRDEGSDHGGWTGDTETEIYSLFCNLVDELC